MINFGYLDDHRPQLKNELNFIFYDIVVRSVWIDLKGRLFKLVSDVRLQFVMLLCFKAPLVDMTF